MGFPPPPGSAFRLERRHAYQTVFAWWPRWCSDNKVRWLVRVVREIKQVYFVEGDIVIPYPSHWNDVYWHSMDKYAELIAEQLS